MWPNQQAMFSQPPFGGAAAGFNPAMMGMMPNMGMAAPPFMSPMFGAMGGMMTPQAPFLSVPPMMMQPGGLMGAQPAMIGMPNGAASQTQPQQQQQQQQQQPQSQQPASLLDEPQMTNVYIGRIPLIDVDNAFVERLLKVRRASSRRAKIFVHQCILVVHTHAHFFFFFCFHVSCDDCFFCSFLCCYKNTKFCTSTHRFVAA
jgi:hypothetical protein